MKKSRSSYTDRETPKTPGPDLWQAEWLPLPLSQEELQSIESVLGEWWLYLQEMFGFSSIRLELAGENGEHLNVHQPHQPITTPRSATEQRYPLTTRTGLLGWLYTRDGADEPSRQKELTSLLPLIGQSFEGKLERIRLGRVNNSLVARHNGVFESLVRLLGLRDHETESHTLRVSQITMQLVEHLGLPPEQHTAIRHGALLHDIGKLGIPDAVLLKPGSLTPMERRMMELHVTYGYKILSSFTSERQTLDIVLHHHEHWDGNGYPDHLCGEQIPLVARLFAVVDVFDALTSDRPYRTAWPSTRALTYLREQTGKQFDPNMVKAFLEVAV